MTNETYISGDDWFMMCNKCDRLTSLVERAYHRDTIVCSDCDTEYEVSITEVVE